MAFSNGTYSLSTTGNPGVTGTSISSTWTNATLNDLATALTSLGTSVATALTATGSDQAGALQVTSVLNIFSTVAASTGARLSSSAALDGQTQRQVIYNGGAEPLKGYPTAGQKIKPRAAHLGLTPTPFPGCPYYTLASSPLVIH